MFTPTRSATVRVRSPSKPCSAMTSYAARTRLRRRPSSLVTGIAFTAGDKMAAAPGNVLRDRFISVVPERLVRSAQTRQGVFGWVQEDQRISFITIEPLAKSSALVGAEFFDAFLDVSQTAPVTTVNYAIPFHLNQSVDLIHST